MQNSNLVGKAIGNLLGKQKGIVRRKDTVLLIATAIVWVLSTLAPMATDWPLWVSAIIGVVASTAAALVTALTKGAITPSIRDRAEEEARKLEHEAKDFKEEVSGAVSNVQESWNDAVDDVSGIASEYIGKHRASNSDAENTGGIAGHYVNG